MASDEAANHDFIYHEIESVFIKWFGNSKNSETEIRNAAQYFTHMCELPLDFDRRIWSSKETDELLSGFKKSLDELFRNYNKLPNPVRKELDRNYLLNAERIGPGKIVLKTENGYSSELALGILIYALRDRIKGVSYVSAIKRGFEGKPVDRHLDAIKEAQERNKPEKELHQNTERKFRKTIAVEQARSYWEYFRGEAAPTSQNEVPGDFGKFLEEAWACLDHFGGDYTNVKAKSLMRTWKDNRDVMPKSHEEI